MFNPVVSEANYVSAPHRSNSNGTEKNSAALKIGKLSAAESKELEARGKEWASEAEKVDEMLQRTHKDLCNIATQVSQTLINEGVRLKAEAARELEEARKGIVDADKKIADADNRIIEARKKRVEAQKKIADADNRIADADNRIIDADYRIADAQKKRADANNRIADADNRIKLLQKDVLTSALANMILHTVETKSIPQDGTPLQVAKSLVKLFVETFDEKKLSDAVSQAKRCSRLTPDVGLIISAVIDKTGCKSPNFLKFQDEIDLPSIAKLLETKNFTAICFHPSVKGTAIHDMAKKIQTNHPFAIEFLQPKTNAPTSSMPQANQPPVAALPPTGTNKPAKSARVDTGPGVVSKPLPPVPPKPKTAI